MELAPAREMTTSAAANRCFKGASTYSYCTDQAFIQIAFSADMYYLECV